MDDYVKLGYMLGNVTWGGARSAGLMSTRIVHRNGVAFAVKSGRYDNFWSRYERGWEASSFAAIDERVKPGGTFLDVGSWIGPMALYAASKGQRVVCVEADPAALKELQENIEANPSLKPLISIIDRAIYPTEGTVRFGSNSEPGNSQSSIIEKKFVHSWQVATITPRQIADIVRDADSLFVKMDIEGGEYDVFPGLMGELKQKNPVVMVSLHAGHLPYGFLKSRKLSRDIFKSCRGRNARRLRDRPTFAGTLRERLARHGLTIPCPRGTWLIY